AERDRGGAARDRAGPAALRPQRSACRRRRRVIATHAHLDACEAPAGELIAHARAAGVGGVITVGSGIASCRQSLAIAARHEGVYAALGIHPHQAGSDESERLDDLRALLAD